MNQPPKVRVLEVGIFYKMIYLGYIRVKATIITYHNKILKNLYPTALQATENSIQYRYNNSIYTSKIVDMLQVIPVLIF